MTENTTDNQQVNQATNQLTDQQKFLESLPEDLRQEPTMLKFNNFSDMAKSYIGLQRMLGADKNDLVKVPKPDASEKEWNDYYAKLGRPESHDKYAVPELENFKFDDALLGEFKDIAFKNGMSAKQFEQTLAWFGPKLANIVAEQQEKSKQAEASTREALKKEWGAAFEQKVNKIDDTINLYDKDGLAFDKLKALGAFNDPDIWKFFAALGEDLAESDGLKGSGDSPKEMAYTPTQAQLEINKRFGDPAWMKIYTDGNNPMQKHYVEEINKLYKYAYPS